MNHLENYYSVHSFFSEPGVFSPLFDALPDDITELVKIVQGLLVHRVDGHIFGFDIPKERLEEMEIRTVTSMITRLMELNSSPLFIERLLEEKLISSCRDFALLLCAFLRHKNIPARVRIGFAHYLFGGTQDHVLTEYWNVSLQQWCLIDSRITPEYVKKFPRLQNFDILNVSAPHFYLAGEIWKQCYSGQDDPNRYGYGLIRSIRGLRHIQDRLILDLAMLNKIEVLPWDLWGYMIHDLPGIAPHEPEHLALLQQLADITLTQSNQIAMLQKTYQHSQLQLSNPIISSSPVLGQYRLSVEELYS